MRVISISNNFKIKKVGRPYVSNRISPNKLTTLNLPSELLRRICLLRKRHQFLTLATTDLHWLTSLITIRQISTASISKISSHKECSAKPTQWDHQPKCTSNITSINNRALRPICNQE